MKTTILITEHQKKLLIIESIGNEITDEVENNKSLFKKISDYSNKEFGDNLVFLVTWGAGIGGFMNPVKDMINLQFPDLSQSDVYLIMVGILGTLFFNNKPVFSKIKSRIKEKGLVNELKLTLSKTKELKNTFIKFLGSIGVTVSNMITMLSYAFMIPVLGTIINIIENGDMNETDLVKIVAPLAASKLISISNHGLKELLSNLFFKIKNI